MRYIARTVALLLLLLGAACSGIHYVDSECPQCRVLNARLKPGERPSLPRLRKDTTRLFILIPGVLGYSWEWNAAVRSLEAAEHVEFVVFWWEPFGTIGGAADELAHWTNDLLGANELPALQRIDVVAHSMGGLVTALALPKLIPLPGVTMRVSTIGTPFAGMIGPEFFYPDSHHSFAILVPFSPWLHYPAVPNGIELTEYRTTSPEDPVMEPRFGHDPAPENIGPRPRRRVQLPHMDHNRCVGLVVERLLRGEP